MMNLVLAALIPIAGLLLLGKLIATGRILDDAGWLGLERITYFVLFPALIVSKLAVADFSGVDWRLPTVLLAAQLGLTAATLLFTTLLRTPRDRIGVYVQSAARWNTFIALALAQDLIGAQGLALVAVAAAIMIPTANVVSVSALMHFSSEKVAAFQLLKQLAVNPLVLACVIGLGMNATGLTLHVQIMRSLDLLSQATIALGLLTTGAAIKLRGERTSYGVVLSWSLLRLFGLALLAGGAAIMLGLSGDLLLAILIATVVPTAVNGTILARQLGADASLAANLIAVQTILSIVTVTMVLLVADKFL